MVIASNKISSFGCYMILLRHLLSMLLEIYDMFSFSFQILQKDDVIPFSVSVILGVL